MYCLPPPLTHTCISPSSLSSALVPLATAILVYASSEGGTSAETLLQQLAAFRVHVDEGLHAGQAPGTSHPCKLGCSQAGVVVVRHRVGCVLLISGLRLAWGLWVVGLLGLQVMVVMLASL